MPLYTMVRGDKLEKYTPPSCSARLRRQNVIRSSSRPDSPFAPATNSWASSGSTARAPAPQASASYGTSRQPSTLRPSAAASRSMVADTTDRSAEMKARPTA